MSVPDVLLLVTSWLYLGFQWTIRIVVYPQLRAVPATAFIGYEAAHQQLVTRAVGPLFLAFGVGGVVAVLDEVDAATLTALACFVLILATTSLGAVPQHRRLSRGFDAAAYRRLLRVDSARLVLAVVAAGTAVVQVVTA